MTINDKIKCLRVLKGWYLSEMNKDVKERIPKDSYTESLDWAIDELSPQATEPIFFLGERVDKVNN